MVAADVAVSGDVAVAVGVVVRVTAAVFPGSHHCQVVSGDVAVVAVAVVAAVWVPDAVTSVIA